SRYGRRSNWFKIHCLIQDQQEMSNRMVEASKNGGLGLGLGDDHKNSGVLGGADTKDFMAKYKENEMRNSNSVSGVSITSSDHPLNNSNSSNNNNNLGSHHNHHHHHPLSSGSPRLNSPNSSSEGGSSMGRVSVSSPYSSLFEAAKVPAFPSPYLSASASLGPSMAGSCSTAAAAAAAAAAGLTSLSTPTISPLSPLNAAVSRLFLQNSNVNSLLGSVSPICSLPSSFSRLSFSAAASGGAEQRPQAPATAATAAASHPRASRAAGASGSGGSLSEEMEMEMAAAAAA
ncbi:hypothetical protein TYRP_023762, partial [Tyrophagus putrescentiae]